MVDPLSLDDVETATDWEILNAYMREGSTRQAAEAYLSIIRGDYPPGMIID